ncbi:MAG: lysylphosphatidylglycerol synthase transmembrane domain-containing protein [Chloroflexota bacterium]
MREKTALRVLRICAVYLTLGALLYFAFRNAPLSEIWLTLRQLHLWQIALLLGINALVIGFMTMRWWLVVRAENPRLPFIPLIGYRLSVFGMSYFTPGPQVGGEPLQVIYLRKFHNVTLARAVSAVIIDKLLEFLGNFIFIGVGLFAAARAGILFGNGDIPGVGWVALAALMAWPPVHIALLYLGRHPVSRILRAALSRFKNQKWFRLVVVSEYMASTFTRRHPRALIAALGASLAAWTGMGVEYLLMLEFLNVHVDLWQAAAALTASLLAFLMPLPGGLGALEASQVLALGALGYPASTAISLTLIMRARDLLNGGLGLLLAGRASIASARNEIRQDSREDRTAKE